MTETDSPADAKHPPQRRTAPEHPRAEADKRRKILAGARRAFFSNGFDGASMGEIARVAGVSKATIYAYFRSKEMLFHALVEDIRGKSAVEMFECSAEESDITIRLNRIGISFVISMVQPDDIRLARLVMGVAEKFPAAGRTFFTVGPCVRGQKLASILAEQNELGQLDIDDCEQAAFQFFNLCEGRKVKGLLYGSQQAPTQEEIATIVASAVRVFLAAYGSTRKNPLITS